MKHLNKLVSLGIILILGFCLGTLGFSIWGKPPALVKPVMWFSEAQWIAPSQATYRFYARHTFNVPDFVEGGWLRLSADNDFILYVNGEVVAQEVSTLRNTLGLAAQNGDPFQRLNDFLPYLSLRPEWVYLASPKDWKLTAYVDLTQYLKPGKNVIALEVQKGQKNPRFLLEGAVYPVRGETPINLTTGISEWKVATLFHNRQQIPWFDLDFPDENWAEAIKIGYPQEVTYSRLSQHLFDRLLEGSWIGGKESDRGELWLKSTWKVSEKWQRAFIRWAGKGEYSLLINGLLVSHYQGDEGKTLHLHEVTNFLHKGVNTLQVRLARPLDWDWHSSLNGSLRKIEPLGFFLDGWLEKNQAEIINPIATDSTWISFNTPVLPENKSIAPIQLVTILETPKPQSFYRKFEGDAYLLNYPNYVLHQSFWWIVGMSGALIYALLIGYFWLDNRVNLLNSLTTGAIFLLPGTLFLVAINLSKYRYGISERWLLFVQPHSDSLILLAFIGIVLLTLLWSFMGRDVSNSDKNLMNLAIWLLWFLLGLTVCLCFSLAVADSNKFWEFFIWLEFLCLAVIIALTIFWQNIVCQLNNLFISIRQAWPTWGHWVCFGIITIAGFAMRTYALDAMDLEADENTSLDATKGILRTGVPIATSGIWYTRGPLYHYMLAFWLQFTGDSAINARFLSVIWGTATLFLIFILARKITGKVWLALAITAILAFDPWELWYSRFIRFYQVLQFTTILAFWLFIKGFINREGKTYQYCFYIVLTAMLLIQEGSLTLLPAFAIGFLYFYRPFRLSGDRSIVIGSAIGLGIYAFNIIFFSIKCLTPLVALSTSTDSYLKPRLSDVTGFFTNFFIGPNWMNVIYSIFFLAGLVYFLKRRESKLVFLFVTIILNLLFQTILVYVIAARYFYPVYPIFVMLAIYSAICIIESICKQVELISSKIPLRKICLFLLILIFMGNLEIEQVFAAYQDAIAIRNSDIAAYIQTHKKPGDIVISNTSAVYAIKGGLDYYIPHRLSIFDAVYAKEGIVIDRWGGGKLLTNLDQLSHILENGDRIWIHTFDRPRPPKDIEHSQIYSFYQTLGKPAFETFGARLRLWQKEDGILICVPNRGKDLGNY
ncbi:glycosyltransferase family 39 protein [Floridanema evergladense]|uniref:Glycosyltransferase family 39 protein n=1 Tax=Floridaenema evergladense BLCC-F167 TaxID=3153639 RepID=A0ABV4WG45_9CYAN